MIDELEFVIYGTPDIIVDNEQWFLAPFYDNEIELLGNWFTKDIDFKIYEDWDDNYNFNGSDVLIHSKVFTWLVLKFGQPQVDDFSDMVKWDTNHYDFDIESITNIIRINSGSETKIV